jgi:hypothetical protein
MATSLYVWRGRFIKVCPRVVRTAEADHLQSITTVDPEVARLRGKAL